MVPPPIAHYKIISKLGEGAMGEVYRATDTKLCRDVAIKVIPGEFARDATRMARFAREAQVLAALNHPNIAAIYGLEERALVLELVEGPTLEERVAEGPIPLEEALAIARQIAGAVEYAHERGVIHRDLKPANIKVTPQGRVKVLDFGLAKVQALSDADDTITAAGVILGTAAYMSPEQAVGKPIDGRSDIFSFGLLLYEMLSGQRAFAEERAMLTMMAILHKEPRPLRELAPDLPLDLDRIVSRCLSKNPADRYPGMGAVRQALEELAKQAPSQPQGTSIAVLPFRNLSADKENEYFSDGLAEETLTALGRVPGLRVIARASAFTCRGCSIRETGERLKVATVLLGSVRRAGTRIRVAVQLIHVVDESQIWSERYDRDLSDVFEVQDEIAQAIVEDLRPRLSGSARLLASRQTSAVDGYHFLEWTPFLRQPAEP